MSKWTKTIRKKQKNKIDHDKKSVIDDPTVKKQLSKGINKELKLTIISIFAVTIAMLSSSFAYFSSVQQSKKYNTLTVGTLKIDFIDTDDNLGNVIRLNGAYPESDEIGQQETPYSFKITNSGSLDAIYQIKILDDEEMIAEDKCEDELLNKSEIRVSINGDPPFTLEEKKEDNYQIKLGELAAGDTASFDIRIWISENSNNDILGKHYHGKIVVESNNV